MTFPADVFKPPGSMCGGTYAQEFDLGTNTGGFTTTPTTGTYINLPIVLTVDADTAVNSYNVDFKAYWTIDSLIIPKEGPSSETFTFTIKVETIESSDYLEFKAVPQ